MAKLGWIGSIALAVGASAGAAGAQFGLGYGLGIISWSPTLSGGPSTQDGIWLSSLAWTTWIAATSTVVGAICADRRSAGEIGAAPPRPMADQLNPMPPGIWATAIWRALLAVSAAVGALLSVALVLVPARAAVRADTSTPQLIAAGYAVVGIIVGIVIAVCALAARAAAANVIATAGWLWALAIATVIDNVAVGRGLGTAPLGVWPFGDGTYFRSTWSLPGAALMLGAALVIGAGAAWQASRRGESAKGTSLSGALGPLLVAVAYFLTAPRLVGLDDPQLSAYLLAPYALIAGLAGSVLLVAIVASRESNRQLLRAARDGSAAGLAGEETVPVRIPLAPKRKPKASAAATVPTYVPVTVEEPTSATGQATVPGIVSQPTGDEPKTEAQAKPAGNAAGNDRNKRGRR
jgi:hypothetical protein